jgi:hypothetical protein
MDSTYSKKRERRVRERMLLATKLARIWNDGDRDAVFERLRGDARLLAALVYACSSFNINPIDICGPLAREKVP